MAFSIIIAPYPVHASQLFSAPARPQGRPASPQQVPEFSRTVNFGKKSDRNNL